MKLKTLSNVFVIFSLFLFSSVFLSAEEWSDTDRTASVFGSAFTRLPGSLEIGTRIIGFTLSDDSQDYVGSVDLLEEKQNYDPTRIFLDWYFKSFETFDVGMELTWDRLALKTVTTHDGHTDGTLFMSGPILSVMARFNQFKAWKPYIGAGAFFVTRTHVSKGWWHYGFNGETSAEADAKYNEWRDNGSPSWPNQGYTRQFELDETTGFVWIMGTEHALNDRVSLDIYLRYMNLTVDNTFTLNSYGNTFRTQYTEWDVDNLAYGIGIKYRFS